MKRVTIISGLTLPAFLLLFGCSDLGNRAPTGSGTVPSDSINFTNDVLPIFQAHCTSCHSGSSPSGQLDLSTFAGVLDNIGPSAPVVQPGNPNNSMLVKRLTGAVPPLMPQGGPQLPSADLATISLWIEQGALNSTGGGGGGGGGGGADTVSYTNDIQPIFTNFCVSCHAAPALPSYGALDLTSYSGLMSAAGPNAPLVVPGDSLNSYLVQRLKGAATPQMPQNATPLSAVQVSLICLWIQQGAVDDTGGGGGGGGGGGADSVSYTNDVQPLFNSYCTSCHAAPASPGYGGLDLTTYSSLMSASGPHAPVVVPGDSTASYIVQRLKGTATPQMPQGAAPFSTAQISLICLWIQQGAVNDSSGGGGGGGAVSYTNQVQPIFDSHCVSCHASPASPSYGGLDLTSYDGLMSASGPNAPLIIAGNPANSYLIKRMSGAAAPQMPPGGPYLTQGQIDLISQWIQEGAVNDGGGGGGGPASFAGDILPIFQTHCISCHAPPEPPEGLDLTSYAGLMYSGENQTVVPYNADQSLLVTMITPGATEEPMPPGGPYLTSGQIDLIRQWIDDGALNN